jgi:hypothetical protein
MTPAERMRRHRRRKRLEDVRPLTYRPLPAVTKPLPCAVSPVTEPPRRIDPAGEPAPQRPYAAPWLASAPVKASEGLRTPARRLRRLLGPLCAARTGRSSMSERLSAD